MTATLQAEVRSATVLRFDDGQPVRAASAVTAYGGGWLVVQDEVGGEVLEVEGLAPRDVRGDRLEVLAVVDVDDPEVPSTALVLEVRRQGGLTRRRAAFRPGRW